MKVTHARRSKLHAGTQRNLPEMRYMRRDNRMFLITRTCDDLTLYPLKSVEVR